MVMVGGAIGSLMRYVLGTAILNRVGTRFPLGTVTINITGCFLVGFIKMSPNAGIRIRTGALAAGGRISWEAT